MEKMMKIMLEQWGDEWDNEELSDAQLENIFGGTGDNPSDTPNFFLPIEAGQEKSLVDNGPNIAKAVTGFATVSEVTGVGNTYQVFTLTPEAVYVNPAIQP